MGTRVSLWENNGHFNRLNLTGENIFQSVFQTCQVHSHLIKIRTGFFLYHGDDNPASSLVASHPVMITEIRKLLLLAIIQLPYVLAQGFSAWSWTDHLADHVLSELHSLVSAFERPFYSSSVWTRAVLGIRPTPPTAR